MAGDRLRVHRGAAATKSRPPLRCIPWPIVHTLKRTIKCKGIISEFMVNWPGLRVAERARIEVKRTSVFNKLFLNLNCSFRAYWSRTMLNVPSAIANAACSSP